MKQERKAGRTEWGREIGREVKKMREKGMEGDREAGRERGKKKGIGERLQNETLEADACSKSTCDLRGKKGKEPKRGKSRDERKHRDEAVRIIGTL